MVHVRVAFLAVGLLFPLSDARIVGQGLTHDREMPIVKHDKAAGDDYNKGSPLYEKQEERKKQGIPAVKPAEPKPTEPQGNLGSTTQVSGSNLWLLGAIVVLTAFCGLCLFFAKVRYDKRHNVGEKHVVQQLLEHHDSAKELATSSTYEFRKTVGVPLCLGALIYGSIGYLAIEYSREGSPGVCKWPLAKLLFAYGCVVLIMAGIMICTIAYPPAYMCKNVAHSICQCIALAMTIVALISYSEATQCGAHLWWATLILSSPLIACCVYCCCTPFGAAKGAAFLGYKATTGLAVMKAPSYKATATVLTKSS